ncbi:hypothetical protein ABGB14_28670 [Nonomuraea sp. B10E15]|uniref:hypothetical protein n=1 Tax=Nonomuraea sp. B10E15 TaxID=3153560 RepID=UPI00325F8988
MPNYEELKGRLYSEIQALEARTQAAKELQDHFGEGGWDESVTGVLSGYHDGAADWQVRLSSVLRRVEQREEEERSNPGFVFARFAADLDDAGERMASVHEEVAKQMTIAQEELAKRLTAAQHALGQESSQIFHELADRARDAGSAFDADTHSGSEPEQSPAQPDDNRDDELPEGPDPWSKS